MGGVNSTNDLASLRSLSRGLIYNPVIITVLPVPAAVPMGAAKG